MWLHFLNIGTHCPTWQKLSWKGRWILSKLVIESCIMQPLLVKLNLCWERIWTDWIGYSSALVVHDCHGQSAPDRSFCTRLSSIFCLKEPVSERSRSILAMANVHNHCEPGNVNYWPYSIETMFGSIRPSARPSFDALTVERVSYSHL